LAASLLVCLAATAAGAQGSIWPHCLRNSIMACDPRRCDLPWCRRQGPVYPRPPHFTLDPGPWPSPVGRGGIPSK
jgi:hypothetical protein